MPTCSWQEGLFEIAASQNGINVLLGKSGISVSDIHGKRSRVVIDPVALYLAGLGNFAGNTKKAFSIGLPPGGRHLPLLIACTKVLSLAVEKHERGKSGVVLVVSPDLDVRSKYSDLYVRSVPLDEAYPGSRMMPTGERISLKTGQKAITEEGVCFFLYNRLDLPNEINFEPKLIIVDMRQAKWANRSHDLLTWLKRFKSKSGILGLYTVGDRQTREAFPAASFVDFQCDHKAVEICKNTKIGKLDNHKDLLVDWYLSGSLNYLKRKHRITVIETTETVEDIFTGLSQLIKELETKHSPDVDLARILLSKLCQMPVKIIDYEAAAYKLGQFTLKRSIERLGYRNTDESLTASLESIRMFLKQLYELLSQNNPRFIYINKMLPKYLEKNKEGRLLILIRDSVSATAFKDWLLFENFENRDMLQRLDVKKYSDYQIEDIQEYVEVIVNGVLPRRYSWIAGGPLSDKVRFLSYSFETSTVEKQLSYYYDVDKVSKRSAERFRFIHNIRSGFSSDENIEPTVDYPILNLEKPEVKGHKDSVVTNVGDLAELMKMAEAHAKEEKEETEHDSQNMDSLNEELSDTDIFEEGEEHEEDVVCVKFGVRSNVRGLGSIWLREDSYVEYVPRAQNGSFKKDIPKNLEIGDVLIRIDEKGRSSLYEQILNLVENQPEYRYFKTFRLIWRQAMEKMVEKYTRNKKIDFTEALKDLNLLGAPIQTELSLRYWVGDAVIGPEAIESITAIGNLVQIEVLSKGAKDFAGVLSKIRALHRGVGKKLNSVIRKQFKRTAGHSIETEPEWDDDRFSLPINELIDSIDFMEIKSVEAGIQKVNPSLVGKFII